MPGTITWLLRPVRKNIPLRWTLAAFSLAALMTAGAAGAQAIAVSPTYKGLFASTDPTMTFLFEAAGARATLVFIPGGEGRRGIKPEWTASHGYFARNEFIMMLRSLSDPSLTSGRVNVVIFDSPEDLPTRGHWSGARTGADHLSRVEDVVRHYRDRIGKPVWVMGHSMGSISLTEFYKRLQDRKSDDLVAGLILSGGHNGTSFNYETTRLPVLVLHHEQDECVGNTPGYARRLHARLREAGNTAAELVLVNSGTPSSGNPCRSSYHMYSGAGPEVAKVLDQFINRHLGSQ
jgi:pimeloyl-ACP methyl ester carboxylesterase